MLHRKVECLVGTAYMHIFEAADETGGGIVELYTKLILRFIELHLVVTAVKIISASG